MLYTDSGSPIPNDKPMEQDNRKWITDRTPVESEANFYSNVEVPASSRSSEPITSSGRRFTKFYMIKQGEPWLPASIEYYKDRQALVAEGYEQGLAAGRAEQQETTEPPTEPEPEPSDFQTLHGIALDMVDSLRPIVIPEILNVLRRAIREPLAEQQAAAEATPELEPEPVHSQYFSGHGLIAGEIDRALAEGGWTPTPEPTPEPEPSPSPAADGGLVEEAVRAMRAAPLGYQPEARAAILRAAGWLHREGHLSAAALLEQEANR